MQQREWTWVTLHLLREFRENLDQNYTFVNKESQLEMPQSSSLQDLHLVSDKSLQEKFRIERDIQATDVEDGQIGEVIHND